MAQGNRTFLNNLVDPEVLADMVSGKVEKYIRVTPFAKIDNTLQGQAGSTIKVPFYGHIGEATVVEEGEEIPVSQLTTSTKEYTVHKIAKGATISDEAMLSGYGDPVNQCANQLAQSIAGKMDTDAIDELYKADRQFIATTKLTYNAVVDTIDVFNEEINSPKVMFVNPSQVTTLRKDANFISADKYGASNNVVMYGEIGMIANTRIVSSKRVVKNSAEYYKDEDGDLTIVADTATPTSSQVKLSTVKESAISGYTPVVGDKVSLLTANTYWKNPIIKIVGEDEVETGVPAITIYTKAETFVEPEREANKKQTSYYADKHAVVALTNADNVVVLYATV